MGILTLKKDDAGGGTIVSKDLGSTSSFPNVSMGSTAILNQFGNNNHGQDSIFLQCKDKVCPDNIKFGNLSLSTKNTIMPYNIYAKYESSYIGLKGQSVKKITNGDARIYPEDTTNNVSQININISGNTYYGSYGYANLSFQEPMNWYTYPLIEIDFTLNSSLLWGEKTANSNIYAHIGAWATHAPLTSFEQISTPSDGVYFPGNPGSGLVATEWLSTGRYCVVLDLSAYRDFQYQTHRYINLCFSYRCTSSSDSYSIGERSFNININSIKMWEIPTKRIHITQYSWRESWEEYAIDGQSDIYLPSYYNTFGDMLNGICFYNQQRAAWAERLDPRGFFYRSGDAFYYQVSTTGWRPVSDYYRLRVSQSPSAAFVSISTPITDGANFYTYD